jgi:hypothetical protein
MDIDSGSSSPVLAKRDHEGDIDMGDFSPENVSRCSLFFHYVTLTCGLDRKEHVTYEAGPGRNVDARYMGIRKQHPQHVRTENY